MASTFGVSVATDRADLREGHSVGASPPNGTTGAGGAGAPDVTPAVTCLGMDLGAKGSGACAAEPAPEPAVRLKDVCRASRRPSDERRAGGPIRAGEVDLRANPGRRGRDRGECRAHGRGARGRRGGPPGLRLAGNQSCSSLRPGSRSGGRSAVPRKRARSIAAGRWPAHAARSPPGWCGAGARSCCSRNPRPTSCSGPS